MSKENLFQLIRKEEVIVWAGAGMSMYAGYPSGVELSKMLYNDLNMETQQEIGPGLSLMETAEMYVRSKGGSRNELNVILTKIFKAKPKSTQFHDILATIPHIKTIITTNYDNLFEIAYGADGHSIFLSSQIANFSKNSIEIFKAHGDLSNPDSLIITRNDYDRFFKVDSRDNLFWNAIRERLATNAVLFLGYSLEDSNVSVIFDKITEELKNNRKQVFLVAPNVSKINQRHLSQKNIQYINSTGEELIKELLETINQYIVGDFENNRISSNSLGSFLKHQNISSKLTYIDGKQSIESLQPIDPTIIGRLRFSVNKNEEIHKSISEYISGQKVGSIKIPKEKILEFEIWIGNTKISSHINDLTIKSVPSGIWNVTLRFDNGFEYDDIVVEAYKTENTILTLNVQLKKVLLEIRIDLEKTDIQGYESQFSYTHEHTCGKIKDEIEVFTLLSKIANGDKFVIFYLNKPVHTGGHIMMKPLYEQLRAFLAFFDGLRQIEKHYQLIFDNLTFDAIDTKNSSLITEILAFTEGGYVEQNFKEGMKIDFDLDPGESARELDLIKNLPKDVFELCAVNEHVIGLFGHQFNLGFKVYHIVKPEISNKARAINGMDQFFHLRSKKNKRLKFFTKTYMGASF